MLMGCLLDDASQIETSDAITVVGEVTALADSPRVLKTITDRKYESLLTVLVGPVLNFEMPQEILLDAATYAVPEGARFGPALAEIAEQGTSTSTQSNGQLPWTGYREALVVCAAELQHGPGAGYDLDEVENAYGFVLSVLSRPSAAMSESEFDGARSMNCEVVVPGSSSMPVRERCRVCGRTSSIAEADGSVVDVHDFVLFEPRPECVVKVEHFGLRVSREDQELCRGCLESRRKTADGEVIAISCVDGVALECSTPSRSE